MRGWIDWARKYPMTMLLIICCLIGGPYFGGQRAIEAYKNYTGKATAGGCPWYMDPEGSRASDTAESGAQGTKKSGRKKGGPFSGCGIRVIWMMRCLSVIPERIH